MSLSFIGPDAFCVRFFIISIFFSTPAHPILIPCYSLFRYIHSFKYKISTKGGLTMNDLIQRMIRAAKLDVTLYEEVEADTTAFKPALAVVAISSIASGIGNLYVGFGTMIGTLIISLVAWFVWSYVIFLVGTKLLPEPQTSADYGQLLRCIGFASAPGVICVLGIIPPLNALVFFTAGIWMIVATVIAVRQALDYTSTGRAVGVCVLGFLAFLVIQAILGVLLIPFHSA